MIIFEVFLALLVGGAALSLILLPLLRPVAEAPMESWDLPDMEETRKGQALLALKEIEFDLATGKLSDADFALLKRKFTAEAVAAINEDRGVAAAAVIVSGSSKVACPTCGPRPESDAIFCSTCGRLLSTSVCAGCGHALVPGVKFCDSCGRKAA